MAHRFNIHEQQVHNRRMTILGVGAFLGFFVLLGLWFDAWTGRLHEVRTVVPFFIVPVLLSIAIYLGWSFWMTSHSRVWYRFDNELNIEEALRRSEIRWAFILILTFFFVCYFTIVYLEFLRAPRSALFQDVFVGSTFPWGTLLVSSVGCFSAFLLSFRSTKLLAQTFRLRLPSPTTDEEKRFLAIVDDVSIAADLMQPQAFIMRDNQPNAFSFGVNPQESMIVVTSGLLALLSPSELQAVVAHEIGHIQNQDTRLMSIITGLYGSAMMISDWSRVDLTAAGFLARARLPRLRGKGGPVMFLLALLATFAAPLTARLLALGISRRREYVADASAVELTKNPSALADALRKLGRHNATSSNSYRSVAHLCIVDPSGQVWGKRNGILAEWLSTHPPLENRILFLNAMASRYPPQMTVE